MPRLPEGGQPVSDSIADSDDPPSGPVVEAIGIVERPSYIISVQGQTRSVVGSHQQVHPDEVICSPSISITDSHAKGLHEGGRGIIHAISIRRPQQQLVDDKYPVVGVPERRVCDEERRTTKEGLGDLTRIEPMRKLLVHGRPVKVESNTRGLDSNW